jgi:hypothetical protein
MLILDWKLQKSNFSRVGTDGYLEHFLDNSPVLNDKVIITDVDDAALVFRGLGAPAASFVIDGSQTNLAVSATPPGIKQNWTIPADGWNTKLPNERPEWKFAFQNRSTAQRDSYSYQPVNISLFLPPNQQTYYCRLLFFVLNAGNDADLSFGLTFDTGAGYFATVPFSNYVSPCNSTYACQGGSTLAAGPLARYNRQGSWDESPYYIHTVTVNLTTLYQNARLLSISMPTSSIAAPILLQIQGQRSCARQDTDRCGVCFGVGSTCPILAKPIHYVAAAAAGQQQVVDLVQYSIPSTLNQLVNFAPLSGQGVLISKLDQTRLNVTTLKCAVNGNFSIAIQHSQNLTNIVRTNLVILVARLPSTAENVSVTVRAISAQIASIWNSRPSCLGCVWCQRADTASRLCQWLLQHVFSTRDGSNLFSVSCQQCHRQRWIPGRFAGNSLFHGAKCQPKNNLFLQLRLRH